MESCVQFQNHQNRVKQNKLPALYYAVLSNLHEKSQSIVAVCKYTAVSYFYIIFPNPIISVAKHTRIYKLYNILGISTLLLA